MNIDRNLRTRSRLLMALPIAALALSLAACGSATRPTADQVSDGLGKYLEEQGLGDSFPESATECFAGYLVDSELSNDTLNYIAEGKDQASSVEDGELTQKILQDNAEECMS